WPVYSSAYAPFIAMAKALAAKTIRDQKEEQTFRELTTNLTLGYCLGGTWWRQYEPQAYEIVFEPLRDTAPHPVQLTSGHFKFWGCPSMIDRVLWGIDGELLEAIKASPHWKG